MAEASIGLVLDCADQTQHIDAGATRLEGIGARRVETQQRAEHGMRWVIMADPEGNEFASAMAARRPAHDRAGDLQSEPGRSAAAEGTATFARADLFHVSLPDPETAAS